MLRVLHHYILPAGNILPDTFNAAKKMVEELLIPVRRYDVCPRDHVVFDGKLKDNTHCPECNEPR